jgi:hypothetical protein
MSTSLETDPIVKWLKELNIPVTRQSFIDLNWGDNVPDPWNAEAEYEIPTELQDWSWLPHPGSEPDEDEDERDPDDSDYDESDMK